ncbi:hypothetical protein ACIOHE_26520 [Streptomyces sp. NPDC087851]|uniref:hypothetical protein n=1 Tax=Streptomyces sp. NPDC087851 TaxID=3365810 RepID=UPI003801870E
MSTPTRQQKRTWAARLAQRVHAAKKAADDVLVDIYEARQDGLTQADIAYMIGGVSPSGIAAKAAKGEKIALERKQKGSTPS